METKTHSDDSTNFTVERAKKAILDGNLDYALFLYRETLAAEPENITVRSEMHKLRKSLAQESNFTTSLKSFFLTLKIAIDQAMSKNDLIIKDCEHLLDLQPNNVFALKTLLQTSSNLGYDKLTIFLADEVLETDHDVEDIIIIAKAFLNEKILDKASKIAKEGLDVDPDNEELKDIVWKASVEKHTNTSTPLVTAEDNRFIPPKIDTNKIFISSHKKEEPADKNKKDRKDRSNVQP